MAPTPRALSMASSPLQEPEGEPIEPSPPGPRPPIQPTVWNNILSTIPPPLRETPPVMTSLSNALNYDYQTDLEEVVQELIRSRTRCRDLLGRPLVPKELLFFLWGRWQSDCILQELIPCLAWYLDPIPPPIPYHRTALLWGHSTRLLGPAEFHLLQKEGYFPPAGASTRPPSL